MDPTPLKLLEVCEAAAKQSTNILTDKYGGPLNVQTKSSATDLVTEVDGAAQEAMIAVIQDSFPDHRFIAEEEGADSLGSADSPYEWIIDPLDGTTNFVHGKPNFGTIVAVQKAGELQAAVMNMPLLKQHFAAALGSGSTYNGQPVQLRQTKNMDDAVLCCNTARRARTDDDGNWFVYMPRCGGIENYGCAAQELGDILAGWNDGAFFNGIRLWDIAAGCLQVAEAGGKYRYEFQEEGNPRSGLYAAISTEPIFDELCDFVFTKELS